MPLIMAPRGAGKSWLQQNIYADSMRISGSSKLFPRKTGFNNESALLASAMHMRINSGDLDINDFIIDIGAHIKNLGEVNIDYILSNIRDYIAVYDLLNKTTPSNSRELMYSKALSRLISINLYNKLLGEPHTLPTLLSRKFKDIELHLSEYIRNKKDLVKMGMSI